MVISMVPSPIRLPTPTSVNADIVPINNTIDPPRRMNNPSKSSACHLFFFFIWKTRRQKIATQIPAVIIGMIIISVIKILGKNASSPAMLWEVVVVVTRFNGRRNNVDDVLISPEVPCNDHQGNTRDVIRTLMVMMKKRYNKSFLIKLSKKLKRIRRQAIAIIRIGNIGSLVVTKSTLRSLKICNDLWSIT